VIDAVRRLSRATKRLPLKSAGRSRAYASVMRHTGRTSGREYQTPVHAVATADGSIYRKLGTPSRSQAVARSHELGLLEG
jgi:hypothetical protein